MVSVRRPKTEVDVGEKAGEESTINTSSTISDCSCQSSVKITRSRNGRTRGPTKKSTIGGWTKEEDEVLIAAVKTCKGKKWKAIANLVPNRTDVQCLHRWQKVLDPNLVKGPWTPEEDEIIIKMVKERGPKKWSCIAKQLDGRIGKQCRERWYNQLNPEINKGPWTEEEEEILISAHQELGNRWAKIAELLPGRSENSIKNHWNCSVQKRLDSGLLDQPRSLTAQNSTAVSAHVDSSRPALDLGNEFSSPTASCPPSGEHSGFTTPQHQPVHKDARSLLNTPRNPISKKLFISENSYSLVSLKQVMEEITPMDVGNDHGHNHGQNGYIISLSNNEMDPVTVLRQAGRAYKNTPSIISRGRHRLSPSPSSYISKGRQRSSPITPSCNFEDDSTPNVESVASCSIRHAQLNKSGIEKFNGGEHIRRLF